MAALLPNAAVIAAATRNSLYVGDLEKTVDEGLMYQIFSKVGPVASIRVCRDSVTRKSLGYAYVNYISTLDPHAAEKAIELLAYTPVKGHPMRIMWAERDPTKRKSGVGNVFVKGLTPGIDSRTLHDTFEVFGAITSAKVAMDDEGKSLGYGYVQYQKPDFAQEAVDRANGMLLEGKQLYVAHYTSKDSRKARPGFTNMYVKSLPSTIDTEAKLCALFKDYGEITSAMLAKEQSKGLKGFGFVNLKDPVAAAKAVKEMNGKEIDGVKVYVAAAQKKAERRKLLEERFEKRRREVQEATQGKNLYIKHLDAAVTDADLQKLFSKFGTITSAKVMSDEEGKSRCFGFVCFNSMESASRALSEMNNSLHNGQYLYVSLAQPKAIRQAQIERDRMARLSLNMGLGLHMPYTSGNMANMAGVGSLWGGGSGLVAEAQQMGGTNPHGGRFRGGGGGGGQRNQSQGHNQGQHRGGGGGGGGGGRSFNPRKGGPGRFAGGRNGVGLSGCFYPSFPNGGGRGSFGKSKVHDGHLPSRLVAAPPEKQKILLGEHLYPQVEKHLPDKAAKITGMLLEMDNSEVLYLVENEQALHMKIKEAVEVLNEHDVMKEKESVVVDCEWSVMEARGGKN
ncbi:hypothetical protein BSKO_07784 [Bryopsis sp. KO-2023]|nr:hypothetical protein BSKO_07784 [Bryopsis sp. KO-2023]